MDVGPSSHMSADTKLDAKLGRDIQSKIGQQLRAMYDDVVNQGVPDRFSELLRRLDVTNDEKPGDDKAPR
jgi:Anti-sigma factor NepR